jgi:hypothetical protein
MIEIITDQKLITKYQRALVQNLKTTCTESGLHTVGYQGGNEDFVLHFSNKFIWLGV